MRGRKKIKKYDKKIQVGICMRPIEKKEAIAIAEELKISLSKLINVSVKYFAMLEIQKQRDFSSLEKTTIKQLKGELK